MYIVRSYKNKYLECVYVINENLSSESADFRKYLR